jgi:CubicO group peptidase (beta-lactamase class C family)
MGLSSEAVGHIKSTLNAACADANKGIPGLVGIAVGKDGKELFAHAAGKRGFGSEEPMTLENIFWIASCTKMITGVACMQLVERGQQSLDDADQVAKLCPEIKNLGVLRPNGKLVPATRGITLRMLLAHTGQEAPPSWSSDLANTKQAGFGYTFFHEGLRDYSKPVGYDEFSGHIKDLVQPLVHQPGEGWQYGVRLISRSDSKFC